MEIEFKNKYINFRNLRVLIDIFFKTYNLISCDKNKEFSKNSIIVKSFPQISTPNYKIELYNFLRKLIIKNLDKITEKQLIEIFNENEIYQYENFSEIILAEDFYGIDDILEIIFPNKEYQKNTEYQNLRKYSDAKITIKPIQTFENKLFIQKINNKNRYYFYFSYGTINNINLINWKNELKVYINEINNILLDYENLDSIILAGHSIGSIVIQYLALELIKNNLNSEKIYLIGSGCILSNILDNKQVDLIKKKFNQRNYFILSSYLEKKNLYFDSKDNTNLINKIITHLFIKNENQKIIEVNLNKEKLNYSLFSTNKILLHDFSSYLQYYLSSTHTFSRNF